jgi:hypothetical protein
MTRRLPADAAGGRGPARRRDPVRPGPADVTGTARHTAMHRRSLLAAALAPAVLAGTTGAARAAAWRPEARPAPRLLQVRHAASGARFSGTYHNGLAPDPAALANLSAVLADSRTGAVHPFDPRVLDIL